MLHLSPEQEQRLRALLQARDLARVGAVLAQAFPEVAARLGERRAALLEHGWQRARGHGLSHGLALARYLAAWFAFGADFEQQPGHGWARELLGRHGSSEGAKAYQLGRLSLETLRARAGQPGLMPAEQFEAALALLDEALVGLGAIGSPLARLRLPLGQACDIGAIRLELTEAAQQRREYAHQQGGWQLQPALPEGVALTLDGGQGLPPQLHLLSAASSATAARLRVRLHLQACCDPTLHPLLSLNSEQGLRDWRGLRALDWSLALPAAPAPAGLGEAAGARISTLRLDSCGLRDSGAALGTQQTLLAVYPAAQQLLSWRREPGPELLLPSDTPPAPLRPQVRRECDGQTQDIARWQLGLMELDRRLQQGLQQLLGAWEREAGLQDVRLRAQPALLAGEAGLAWGYREASQPLSQPPWMQMQAALDLLAWQLELQLSGRLLLEGSQSLLTLSCSGREELRLAWRNSPAETAPPSLSFRHPLRLQLQPLASAEAQVLGLAAAPAAALVGSLGLRPRQDGPGLEWFVRAALEPLTARLRRHDPWLGSTLQDLALLPALTLVDWSLA
jgi:hypothetical protein